jgi:hypothetical protein
MLDYYIMQGLIGLTGTNTPVLKAYSYTKRKMKCCKFLLSLRMGPIGWSVSLWQAFPAWWNVTL